MHSINLKREMLCIIGNANNCAFAHQPVHCLPKETNQYGVKVPVCGN